MDQCLFFFFSGAAQLHKGGVFIAKAGARSVEFKVVDFITDSVDSDDAFCLVDDNTQFFCDEPLKVDAQCHC